MQDGRRAGAGRRLGGHPRGHLAGVAVVEDGRVLDADAEARQQLVEVGAVLVLLGLAEHHETAAGGDEASDGRDLLGGEHRRAADGALPLGRGRMRDDEHVGLVEHAAGQRAARVRHDLEVALRESGAAAAAYEAAAGCSGRMRGGDVGPDRPRLAVGLIEDDARHLALAQRGEHR